MTDFQAYILSVTVVSIAALLILGVIAHTAMRVLINRQRDQ